MPKMARAVVPLTLLLVTLLLKLAACSDVSPTTPKAPKDMIVTTMTSTVSTSTTSASVKDGQKKREVGGTKLPIETLFPPVSSKTAAGGNSTSSSVAMQEKLKSVLLNRTLSMKDMDKDLDHLVFSQLPQGSKLILRTVKIVRTGDDEDEDEANNEYYDDEDQDKDEDKDGEEATEWNFILRNDTGEPLKKAQKVKKSRDDDFKFESFLDDEGEEEEEEDLKESSTNAVSDLLSAASHQGAPTSQYHSHGTQDRSKDKETKHYNHQGHGKFHNVAVKNTDDKSVTNYKGKEAGLTDYAKSQGNAASKEGGRYKDSKKKNKGRKVTGFKRVYHKEEFQRTEHFYDDEEAKRIAESFGANDQNEKSSHGLKNDDRKYHGTHKEHTDGVKVENEKGTKNSYDKGIQHAQKHSEQHRHHADHAVRHYPKHGASPNPNHHGAYSTENKQLVKAGPSGAASTSEVQTVASPAPPAHVLPPPASRKPSTRGRPRSGKKRRQKEEDDQEGGSEPNLAMTAPKPLDAKPSEMKMFFSPRERPVGSSSSSSSSNSFAEMSSIRDPLAYAPNFGPPAQRQQQQELHKYRIPLISITSMPLFRRVPSLPRPPPPPPPPPQHYRFTTNFEIPGNEPADEESGGRTSNSDGQHYKLVRGPIAYPSAGYSTLYAGNLLKPSKPSTAEEDYDGYLQKQVTTEGNLISVEKAEELQLTEKGREGGLTSASESIHQQQASTDKKKTLTENNSREEEHVQQITSAMIVPQHAGQRQVGWVPLGQGQGPRDLHHHHHQRPPQYHHHGPKFPFSLNPFKSLIPNMFHRQPRHHHHPHHNMAPPPGGHHYNRHYVPTGSGTTQKYAPQVAHENQQLHSVLPAPPQTTTSATSFRQSRPSPAPLLLKTSTTAHYEGNLRRTKPTVHPNAGNHVVIIRHNGPIPPHKFVNGLMDSVAGFFSAANSRSG